MPSIWQVLTPESPGMQGCWQLLLLPMPESPIDLITDPVPILGYLDDLIVVPLGIWLALKLIPPSIMSECRQRAEAEKSQGKPNNWVAAGIIVAIWLLLGILAMLWLVRILKK